MDRPPGGLPAIAGQAAHYRCVTSHRFHRTHRDSRRTMAAVALSMCAAPAAMCSTPVAHAEMHTGNYEMRISGRYDFHTWVWAISSCPGSCVVVNAIPRPVAKAYEYAGTAQLADGRYTLTVDVPDGLRCGDVYYGPIVPTHDVYSWDATTLTGSVESSFATGCDGAPGGAYTYPFVLVRM